MELPRAVASGSAGDGAPDDRVRAGRVAAVAGALAAAYVLALAVVRPAPQWIASLVGGPSGVERFGGLRMHWQGADGSIVPIERTGVSEAYAAEVVERFGGGGIEFREVIESDAAQQLVALGVAFQSPDKREPQVTVELWTPESSPERHTDYYTWAHSRETLDAMFAEARRHGWQPPAHTTVAYELVEAYEGAKDPRPHWRSYFVSDHVALDGRAIANAYGSYDAITNRPVVLLDFTREGGEAFGELTARIAGHKLATILGGVVKSAPVINEPIRGGRASIHMGTSDPATQEHERDLLVEVLRAGSELPDGKLVEWSYVAPARAFEHGLRAALAVLAGLVAAALALLAIRFARPTRALALPLATPRHTWPLGRVAWTAGAIAFYLVATQITLPGINEVELDHVLVGGHVSRTAKSQLGIFALGVMPLVTTFVIVELVASIVPRWRALRDTPEGRRSLGRATAILALAVAAVQAYFVTSWLDGFAYGEFAIYTPPQGGRWLLIATLVAGTACLAILASIIGARGIGNGYAVLLVAGWFAGLDVDAIAAVANGRLVIAAIAIAGTAAIVLGMTSWRIAGVRGMALPLPPSGLSPLSSAGGLGQLVVLLASLGVTSTALAGWLATIEHRLAFDAALVVAATVAWSFAFARAGRRRAELARAGHEPVDRGAWLRATLLAALALVAIDVVTRGARTAPPLARACDPIVLALVIATIADVVAELRARRRALVPAWPLHDPLLVDVARERLAAAGIPHHVQATRLRALLWLVGAFAPMMVLVPPDRAGDAERVMREWLAP